MTGVVVFTCVAAVVFFVLACMDQRKFYWTFASWRYADPEANEPSAAARTMNRVWLLVSCALCLGTAVYALDFDGSGAYSAVEVKAVAKAVASDLERGSGSGFRSSAGVSSEVHDAVREESDGQVEVDGGTDGYELTNVDGENPVCLVVDIERDFDPRGPGGGFLDGGSGGGDTELWSHSVSAFVRDGPCRVRGAGSGRARSAADESMPVCGGKIIAERSGSPAWQVIAEPSTSPPGSRPSPAC